MNITIIGVGYVGLITGVGLAEYGYNVACLDVDDNKIAKLKKGFSPIFEKGLDAILSKNIEAGRISFGNYSTIDLAASDIIYLTVGTPPKDNGEVDLTYYHFAIDTILDYLKEGTEQHVLVNKSTVPVGTASFVQSKLDEQGLSDRVAIVSNPEFLKEGLALEGFFQPERVILGAIKEWAFDNMKKLYHFYRDRGVPFVLSNFETAELIKYASNSFLAMKVSYINEVANLSDKCGADVSVVAKGIGLDSRIGSSFLKPGPGYGGSCFPKDNMAIIHIAKQYGYDFMLPQATKRVNERQKLIAFDKIISQFGNDLSGLIFGVLGVAFKAGTDDVRESASIYLVRALVDAGAEVAVFDPVAMDNFKKVINRSITFIDNMNKLIENKDAIVVMTEWKQFFGLDWEQLKHTMKQPYIFDVRNLYDPKFMRMLDFKYFGLGR